MTKSDASKLTILEKFFLRRYRARLLDLPCEKVTHLVDAIDYVLEKQNEASEHNNG